MPRSLVKNFIVYGLGFGLSKFSMVLVLPFVTSALTPEEFGVIELVQTAYNVLMIFGLLQLDASFQRFYANQEFQQTRLIGTIVLLIVLVNVLLIGAIHGLGWLFLDDLPVGMPVISLMSALVFFSNVSSILFIVYRYDDRAVSLSLLTFIQIAVQVIFIYYFLVIKQYGVFHYFLSQTIGFVVLLVLQVALLKRSVDWRIDRGYLKPLFRFGLPQMPARIGAVLNRHVSKFFIINAMSMHALGIYSAALKVSSMAQIIYMAFNMAWYPMLYKMLNSKDYTKLKIMNAMVVGVCLYASIAFALLSPLMGQLLLSEEYTESVKYMAPLFLSTLLFVVKDSVDIGTRVTEKTQYVSYIYFVAMAVMLVLYTLFSKFGIASVVAIQFAGNLLLVAMTLYNSEWLFKVGFSYLVNIVSIVLCFVLLVVIASWDLSMTQSLSAFVVLTLSVMLGSWITYRKKFAKSHNEVC